MPPLSVNSKNYVDKAKDKKIDQERLKQMKVVAKMIDGRHPHTLGSKAAADRVWQKQEE